MSQVSDARPKRRRLDVIEDAGKRALRAFAPWLLFISVPLFVIRFLIDPGWIPPHVGLLVGVAASALGYHVRRPKDGETGGSSP